MSGPHTSRPPADQPEPFDVTPEPLDRPWQHAPAGDEPPRPSQPARPSRRRTVALGSILALGLAGVVGLGTAGWRIADQKDAALDVPAQVAGLTRDDSERARTTADYLRTAFAAEADLDQSIGAVYADPTDADRSVLLFGGTGLLWRPERDLDRLFGLVADDSGSVTGVRDVVAGELGGVMKCGTTTTRDGDIVVCGWADHGSMMLAMFPGRSLDDSASLLLDIRLGVQTRR